MTRLVFTDLKTTFSHIWIYLVFLIDIIMAIVAFLFAVLNNHMGSGGLITSRTAIMLYDNPIGQAGLVCFTPILSAIPGAGLYYDEKRLNISEVIIPKTGGAVYYSCKLLEALALGFVISILPYDGQQEKGMSP